MENSLSLSKNLPKCPICFEEYDITSHIPRNIPSCGHSLCLDCLKKLIRIPRNMLCPVCRKAPIVSKMVIDSFPVNFPLKELIEEKMDRQLCKKHNKELKFFCVNDGTKLCTNCALFEHKNDGNQHVIEPMEKLIERAEIKVKTLEMTLKKFKKKKDQINQRAEDQKAQIFKQIDEKFKELSSQVDRSKLSLELQVKELIEKGKDRRSHQRLKNRIEDKISEYQEITKASDIKSLMDYEPNSLEESIDNIGEEEELGHISAFLEDVTSTMDELPVLVQSKIDWLIGKGFVIKEKIREKDKVEFCSIW